MNRALAGLAAVALAALVWLAGASPLLAFERSPDLVLRGELTGADHQTYREVPFSVPPEVRRLKIEFEYEGGAEKSVIDLGLRDPRRFRGWSGGNKDRFEISEAEATPSYLAGPLPAGVWRLVLGVPNIRKASRASYTARIYFDKSVVFPGFASASLRQGGRWYRGDLHLHTGHSDGSCRTVGGNRAPCPVFRTLQAAESRGLDFIAVTDHNTFSQNHSLRELAPYFDRLLLIPGREITTFHGHANVFGPTAELDFQLGSKRAPDLRTLLAQAEASGAVFSINHPSVPSGEACMGCGWTVANTDFSRVQAIEVLNGGVMAKAGGDDRPMSGVEFWVRQLNAGLRITAIGGSDNHDPDLPREQASSVGYPTTVVYAPELSQAAVLDGLRAGRVFIDVAGSGERMLDLRASHAGRDADMGEVLVLSSDRRLLLQVQTRAAIGGRLAVITSAGVVAQRSLDGADHPIELELTPRAQDRWVRAEVRGPDGRLWLLSNPIYLR